MTAASTSRGGSPADSTHRIFFRDSRDLSVLGRETVDLVITSPPYPMIQMWDQVFASMSPAIEGALTPDHERQAFEMMHAELDKVWRYTARVLKDGGFACINIGDATRRIGTRFQLFSNHTRITSAFMNLGFDVLPLILWRKTTNAPNKFMGSGMLPAGAYVTLEHEYILIFRKGGKRVFDTLPNTTLRAHSAIFWEERNTWFSDTWDLAGVRQKLDSTDSRGRSAAYPFELAYRLINMYSVMGDTVLDPFLGTGTTTIAAIASGRNSVGIEFDKGLESLVTDRVLGCVDQVNDRVRTRIEDHLRFIRDRHAADKSVKHTNENLGCEVMTRQEREMLVFETVSVSRESPDAFTAQYRPTAQCGQEAAPRNRTHAP